MKIEPNLKTSPLREMDSNDCQDEGYRSASVSPDWKDEQQFTFDTKLESCCSLVLDVWRHDIVPDTSLNKSPEQPKFDAIIAEIFRPNPLLVLPRNYGNLSANRAIVTFDAEKVAPVGESTVAHQVEVGAHFERKPWGIATNHLTEETYLADRQDHVVLVFGPDGTYKYQFGGRGTDDGKFNRPTALAYDSTGDRVFVVDKDNHRIQVFSPDGIYKFQFGSQGRRPGCFWYPWGIAVSKDGVHVAVADARNHRIQLFKSDGTYLRQFTVYSRGSEDFKNIFNYPRGIVFDPTGQYIYVSDFNLHCVFRLNIRLTNLEKILDSKHLNRPSGLDVDASGNLVICDTRNNAVKVFKPNGKPLASFTHLRDSKFDLPLDVSVMPGGFIAVLDLNGRVRIF